MPNTEQSIEEIGIPEVSVSVEVSGMTMVPVDKSLSIPDMAADAAKTGSEIADLIADVAEINGNLAVLDVKNGTLIPMTGETGSESIYSAVSSAVARIGVLEDETGASIPMTGETGSESINSTVSAAVARIAAVENKTGAVIPITGATGADTISEAVNGVSGRVSTLETNYQTLSGTVSGHTTELTELTTAEIEEIIASVFTDE